MPDVQRDDTGVIAASMPLAKTLREAVQEQLDAGIGFPACVYALLWTALGVLEQSRVDNVPFSAIQMIRELARVTEAQQPKLVGIFKNVGNHV